MSPDIANCPWGGTTAPRENQCSIFIYDQKTWKQEADRQKKKYVSEIESNIAPRNTRKSINNNEKFSPVILQAVSRPDSDLNINSEWELRLFL